MMDAFDLSILGPAFLAGLLVLATHVPLGRQVIRRGIIFLDLAVAQFAGFGVLVVQVLEWDGPGQKWIAYLAGVLAALVLSLCERRWADIQEAIIGVSFVLAASAGMLVVAGNVHGGEHLHSLLAGQILWVELGQLKPLAAITLGVLLLWLALGQRLGSWYFYLLFAVAVTTAVQFVGIYLVFASLIVPALAVRRLQSHAIVWGYAIGILAYAAGLWASAYWDLPAGPVIVWALAGSASLWWLARILLRARP